MINDTPAIVRAWNGEDRDKQQGQNVQHSHNALHEGQFQMLII